MGVAPIPDVRRVQVSQGGEAGIPSRQFLEGFVLPRIRTIKPEFWTSEQIVECSPIARLLFIGLWNFCDDAGRHPASAKRTKMEVFPGDSFTDQEILDMIDQLVANELIEPYESEGKSYWQVTGWAHQKIERPNYRYPAPEFDERSTNDRRTIDERSTNDRRTITPGREKEGKRKRKGYPPTPHRIRKTGNTTGSRVAGHRVEQLRRRPEVPDTATARTPQEGRQSCQGSGLAVARGLPGGRRVSPPISKSSKPSSTKSREAPLGNLSPL